MCVGGVCVFVCARVCVCVEMVGLHSIAHSVVTVGRVRRKLGQRN